jgi:hypothetical protein
MAIFVDSRIEVEIIDSEADEIHVLVESACGTYKRSFGPFSTLSEAAEAADAIVRGISCVGGVLSGPAPLSQGTLHPQLNSGL